MDFDNFYISGNGNKCRLQTSCLTVYFICDVNMSSLYFSAEQRACPSRMWHSWTATTHHSGLHSARHVATELTRPKSSGLCHLVCHSQRVYETRVHDFDELRHRVLYVWCSLEQSLIDDAVDQCPTRLHITCVLVFVSEAEILNKLCDYQFVLSVLDELCVSHYAWCSRWCSKIA